MSGWEKFSRAGNDKNCCCIQLMFLWLEEKVTGMAWDCHVHVMFRGERRLSLFITRAVAQQSPGDRLTPGCLLLFVPSLGGSQGPCAAGGVDLPSVCLGVVVVVVFSPALPFPCLLLAVTSLTSRVPAA